MATIFINGLKAKTGGGKSILNNYLALLKESSPKDKFIVLTPEKHEYDKYACESIQIVDIGKLFKSNVMFPLLYHVVLPRLLRSYKIDIIFNLGDIPIPTDIPQIYLFDWPYAVYPDSVVWNNMDIKGLVTRKVKLFAFKRYIRRATVVIAQTQTMKSKLEHLYGLTNVEVVPNAVSLENITGGESFDFLLPKDKTKLLYLTYYYCHKNLEVFLPLAKKIKEMSLPYCIVITIDAAQHNKAEELLNSIRKEGLEDVIVNVGPVSMDAVPSLYSQCDALLMPTLLESFSGTYVEAMFHRKTILTSNLDFAKDVCGQAAFYFDPLDPDSILSSINHAFEDNNERMRRIEEGEKQLGRLLSWEQVVEKYQALIENTITKEV